MIANLRSWRMLYDNVRTRYRYSRFSMQQSNKNGKSEDRYMKRKLVYARQNTTLPLAPPTTPRKQKARTVNNIALSLNDYHLALGVPPNPSPSDQCFATAV